MTDDPSNVRCAPEDILVAEIKEILEMIRSADHVSAVNMHNALWLARGPEL